MYLKTLKAYRPYILLISFSAFIIWPTLMGGYFSHHDDLQIMRIFEMRRCILDLQIPCRWVPDMGWGNGYPLFNYYAVLPYYIGAIISLFTGYVWAAKILFLIPLTFGGISMYIFTRKFSSEIASLIAATLYMFAPYKALDSYVRGDIAEMFALSLIPLVFYFGLSLIKKGQLKYLLGLSLSLFLFLTSHNIMTVLFAPVIFTLFLFWLWQEKFNNLRKVLIGFLIGIGLSAFFIFPAYFEKDLVQIDNLTKLDLDFRAHFVTINQIFLDRSWGYGASKPGIFDTISFQIGWPHWWIAIISALLMMGKLIVDRSFKKHTLYFIVLAIFLLSLFMAHIRSAFIWEAIPILRFTQFPWRFLAISIFSISLIGALFIQSLPSKIQIYAGAILIIMTIFLNWNYFQPQIFYPIIDDRIKLSGDDWDRQQKAAILDYLPKTAVQPREKAQTEPLLRSGTSKISDFVLRSNYWKFKAEVKTPSEIEIPVFDFPGWRVWVNGKSYNFSNDNYLGRISVKLEAGNYLIEGKFQDTIIRTVSNLTTVASFAVFVVLIYYDRKNKLS